ncbi:MAG TPA: NUDIX hydrolase [Beijerinckiaceae bacterium]
MTQDNPWTVLSSKRAFDDPWIAVIDHCVRDAAGRERQYGVVHYKAIGFRVLPIDDEGSTWLVGQYRFAAGQYSWELPAGSGERTEAPKHAAARELGEEVGITASQWLMINQLSPSGAVADAREVSFLAWDLGRTERHPDPQEALTLRRLPFGEAVDLALRGEITNAGSVATLLAVQIKADRGELPSEVERLLKGGS